MYVLRRSIEILAEVLQQGHGPSLWLLVVLVIQYLTAEATQHVVGFVENTCIAPEHHRQDPKISSFIRASRCVRGEKLLGLLLAQHVGVWRLRNVKYETSHDKRRCRFVPGSI